MTIASTKKIIPVYKGLTADVLKTKPINISIDDLAVKNNYFEYLTDDKPTRPFIDLDTDSSVVFENQEEFNRIDEKIKNILVSKLDHYSILHSSHYQAEDYRWDRANKKTIKKVGSKISYRLTDYQNVCDDMEDCKNYSMKIMGDEIKEELGDLMNYVNIDAVVYRKGGSKFSCVNSYKFPQQPDRYKKLLTGKIEDTLIQVLSGYEDNADKIEPLKPLKKVIPKTITKTPQKASLVDALPSYSLNDKYVDLLMNYMKNPVEINYGEFISIGLVLKNNDYPMKLWYDWSQLTPNDYWKSQNQDVVPIKWEEFHSRNYPMGILHKICKTHKPNEWKMWKSKYLTSMNTIPIEDLKKGEIGVIKNILPELRPIIKFSQKRWYICNDKNIWVKSDNCFAIIGNTIHTCLDNSILKIANKLDTEDLSKDEKEVLRKERDAYNQYYNMTGKSSFLSNIQTQFKSILYDHTFFDKIDASPHIIAFKNGIWDLELGKLRDIYTTDYISQTLDFNYTPSHQEVQDEVLQSLKKICNNNQENLDYYLSIIAQSFTGLASKEKSLYFMIGEGGNNGKTTFFEALTDILPIYAYKTDSELIEKKGQQKHKFIAGLKGKRFVWLDEMSRTKNLDEKMLKLLGEGTSIDYKVMYGETASLKNRFKLFMITNHEPNFKTDGGLNNRTKVLKFDSTFSKDTEEDNYAELDFKVDNSIGDKWRTTHKLAIINILFNYAKDYYDDGCKLKPYPSQFEKETSELLENNDSFRMWFNNHFEINPSGRCSKEDVESRLPQDNGKKSKNPRSDMKRLGYKYEGTLNCGRDAEGKKIQGGYKGFVLKKVSCFQAFGIQKKKKKKNMTTKLYVIMKKNNKDI
jgi:P4 family phage/plasmid primase-like protien